MSKMCKHLHTHITVHSSSLNCSREDGLTKAVSCPRQQPFNLDVLSVWNHIVKYWWNRSGPWFFFFFFI